MAPLHTVLGSGPAGTALATELAQRAHPVRLVARSADGAPIDGVERAAADLGDKGETVAATADAAVVYHCVNVPYEQQVAEMPRIGAAIMAGAERAGARLVVLDTLYPYGEAEGEHITEQTPWAATSRKGRMRAELDQRYLDAHASGRQRVVAGRSADFYGPGVLTSTLGGAVFPNALTGQPVGVLGDPDLPHAYTYIHDVARSLATLGEDPAGDGRIWHLPTVPAWSTRDVLAEVRAIIGEPIELEVVDSPRAFGPFDEAFMAEYAEMFYQHTTPQNMVSTAFEERFGVQPTPLGEGLRHTVDFFRAMLASG